MVGIGGVGVVSPLGIGFEEVTAALIDGGRVAAGEPGQMAARVQADVDAWFETSKTYLDRASALTLAAATLARRHAGWPDDPRSIPPERCGIALGTAFGCPDSMIRFWQSVAEKGPRLANALFFTHSYPNTPASMEAIEHSYAGPHLTFCQGAASGALAAACCLDTLHLGRADRMIAGGFDALNPAAAASGTSSGGNHGQIPGEGAVMLALEPLGTGGAAPLGRLIGAGISSFCTNLDPASHPGRSPSGGESAAAIARAMRSALQDSGVAANSAGLVVLSACGDPTLNRAEAAAASEVLGPGGRTTDDGPAFTAVVDRFGFAPGPSALYGVIAALIALREEWVVETKALAGEDRNLNIVREPLEKAVSVVLVNSIDPGGACVTLALAR